MPRLPSLKALRAFEAAARHESFRAAAEELNVTHSAVSHLVKNLEAELAVSLFHRIGRSVRLSEAGLLYAPILKDAFERIARSFEEERRISDDDAPATSSLSAAPAVMPGDPLHCPGRKPPKMVVKRPARPYRTPIQNGFS